MVNWIMLYVGIGMASMAYIVSASRQISEENYEYFRNTSLISLFAVGMLWPITITIAVLKVIFDKD